MNKLDCEIVRDLLPGYIDQLTSEYTSHAVEEHLKECNTCYEMYMDMCGGVGEEQKLSEEREKMRSDKGIAFFLRRVKARAFRKGVVLALLLAGLLAGFLGYNEYWQRFRVAVPPDAVSCEAYRLKDGAVYMTLTVAEEYRVTGWETVRDGDTHYIMAQVMYQPALYNILDDILYSDSQDANRFNYMFTAQELETEITRVVYREGDYGPYQTTHREKLLYDRTQTLPLLEETPEIQPYETWNYTDYAP